MTTYITTIDDLRLYLGDVYAIDYDVALAAAERLQTRVDRPAYGDDWTTWLDLLDDDDVYDADDDPDPDGGAPVTTLV